MCVPVKTRSELVQKCSAAQAKFIIDTQDKTYCILAETRPWKYCIINRKPLFHGRKSDPCNSSISTKPCTDCAGSATCAGAGWKQSVLGQTPLRETEGPNAIKPVPGRHTRQALLYLQREEAEPASAYCSNGTYQSPLAEADPTILPLWASWLPRKRPALPMPVASPSVSMSDHTPAWDLSANNMAVSLVHSFCFSFSFFFFLNLVFSSVVVRRVEGGIGKWDKILCVW